MEVKLALLLLTILLTSACQDITSKKVFGPQGSAGDHTAIPRDSQGNLYGYYEYLPEDFIAIPNSTVPLIFFWNGQNAVSGNGRSDLKNLLNQGLPNLINQGHNYPAIIISGMLPVWNESEIAPFVDYILERYKKHIDLTRVYMTGFSAGGGITLRYVSKFPEKISAIVPIAPAAQPPTHKQPSLEMSKVSSWFFHNSGDMTVEIWRSNVWHKALREKGGSHKITRPDLDSHYAWEQTYTNSAMWNWLFQQNKEHMRTVIHNE